jgi:hypothetical protein
VSDEVTVDVEPCGLLFQFSLESFAGIGFNQPGHAQAHADDLLPWNATVMNQFLDAVRYEVYRLRVIVAEPNVPLLGVDEVAVQSSQSSVCAATIDLKSCPSVSYQNCIPALPQLHLSLFTNPAQRVMVYLFLVSQNRGVGKRFLKAHRLREGTFLPTGATDLVWCSK